ncbi:glycoside hydrolase family 127 protein [Paenibacillus sp. S3N08]|uniref:Glycoside hydrolase family 127 protein n=2 Tax=Paenibacillus agricola TaxID=2716264 RepID=A0ABX0JBS9_9BACL|nr:glycoside hydrolase family 127 protein [Paenibacillus agricola]
MKQVTINDLFWGKQQKLILENVIPFQWGALNDAIPDIEPSHAIENFRIAAGEKQGDYYGRVFQDSDLAKWLETVGYALTLQKDEALEQLADKAIELIGRAQQPDGYLNTYFTVSKPGQRWTNLRDDHELYCAGHMIEAAVSYYEATGKSRLLDIVIRFVEHISSVLGAEPGKKRGYPGHPEIELALMKLYRVTGDKRHLELCSYFVDERGQHPHFFDLEADERGDAVKLHRGRYPYSYSQSHLPVREQLATDGHSVRAMYLYSGMADLAAELGDASLFNACRELWSNLIGARMYITGGIGSSEYGEAFTFDYDLPNDIAYAETCASIGLVFWAHRMLQCDTRNEYADVMERALYNGVMSGMSLDGKKYFYVNPLEIWPESCELREDRKRSRLKTTRQHWWGCACCPPNIARLVASLGDYIYSYNPTNREWFVHLYMGSKVVQLLDGQHVELSQTTNYPWDGNVDFSISMEGQSEFTLALRLPGWCRSAQLWVNGEAMEISESSVNGYVKLHRSWTNGDCVKLALDMPIEIIRAIPKLRAAAGKAALQRGPIVFCLEETDNGANLPDICLSSEPKLTAHYEEQTLNGVSVITGAAFRSDPTSADGQLYSTAPTKKVPVQIKAVPYFAWCNREPGEMQVWIRE